MNWIVVAEGVGAAALGVVVGRFGRRPAIDALVVAVFYVGPWLPQVRFWIEQIPPGRGFILQMDWPLIVPVGYAVLALLCVGIGAAARSQRATTTPTIP